MNTILLISEDYLKTNSNLNDNAFGKWILPAIREAQEMSLMPIIGECLYNKVCELVSNGLIDNDLYAAYKDLLDDRIQPFLLYQTLTNIVPIINGKMANIGTVATNDEHIITLSQGELDLTQNYYRERADFYAKRLQDWVKNNREAFPELECVCSAKPNLERANNSVGIFLGGTRGKRVATSTCGCGSSSKSTDGSYQDGFMDGFNQGMQSGYTSGHTDGYEEGVEVGNQEGYESGYTSGHTDGYEEGREVGNQEGYASGHTDGQAAQKAKLIATAITENGTYAREDGFSSIEVNVPQSEMALQTKSVSQSAVTATYTPDEGYDGIRVITVNATKLAQDKYDQGYADGASKTSCNLQRKSVVVTADTQTVSPDSGYDGMSGVTINASKYGQDKFIEGYLSVDDDSTILTVASAITIDEYGVYKFVYDGNTNVSAMTITFSNGGDTGDTGTTAIGYITLYKDDFLSENKYLWNPEADASTIQQVLVENEIWTGGALYTGNTGNHVKIYFSDGVLPEGFLNFNSVDGQEYSIVQTKMNRIQTSSISIASLKSIDILHTSNGTIIDSNAVINNENLAKVRFDNTSGVTLNSNAIMNNNSLKAILIDWPIAGTSNAFYGSGDNGVVFYHSRVDVQSAVWWPYLESKGWVAIPE